MRGRCLMVGEVAQAHGGSLGRAHEFIDAIADAGADVVKFQTHIAAAESTPSEPWRVQFDAPDASRYDYWKRMEFAEEAWGQLRRHAEDRSIAFCSSPFSIEAVELLSRVGVKYWKVPSGETGNTALIDSILATRLPVVLSSGMSTLDELDRAAARVVRSGVPLTVLQCTSLYPCPPEQIGLNMIPLFRERYGCKVGLSDHSGTIFAGLAAATHDIDMLEVHVSLSRDDTGPDASSSLLPGELESLVQGVRFIETMNAHPVSKDTLRDELVAMRSIFTKSIVAQTDLPAGTILRREHLAAKKPGTGISPERIPELLGRTLRRGIAADELLRESDYS